ncbi:MAG: fused response regulator/phosphatase [Spirochaetales bacterium]|nr:fused response regulator/phosphatase [Spirochaetales bacterium]
MNKDIVLIVDDEGDIRNSLLRNLRKWASGHGVLLETASSGMEALTFLCEHHENTAVIISDQKMPEKSGSEFLCETAALYPSIVTMILTGHADTSDISSFIKAGIYSFLEKPWEKEILISEVEKAYQFYSLRRRDSEQEKIIQSEMQLAFEFQNLFLKFDIPESAVFDFEIAQQHALELSFGGDYFDIITLGEEIFLILLGDVAGHGLRASFIVAVLKSIIHSEFIMERQGRERSFSAELLSWLNRRIGKVLEQMPDIFLAFSACIIDGKTGELVYSNAGLPPLMIVTESGVSELESKDLVLGVNPESIYNQQHYTLSGGDVLVLCTDGIYPMGKEIRYVDKNVFHELLNEKRGSSDLPGSILNTVISTEKKILREDDITIFSARFKN